MDYAIIFYNIFQPEILIIKFWNKISPSLFAEKQWQDVQKDCWEGVEEEDSQAM